MHARVATFEGGQPDQVRQTVADINQQAASGPPEGVPAVGFLMLHNDDGKVLAISLFETEDDLRKGDETLNSMSPPGDGMGQRSSLEVYEVGVKVDA
ncbi:MAG: hypothetical protein QOD53_2379 [Thermoleophilaceae bacterium]|jgi:hypothetical protein|nr:hypothetical protein [Thermoleophilaceae bacterium]